MIKLLVLLSFAAGAVFAHADGDAPASNGTEYMYQTPGGTFMVQPQIAFGGVGIKYNDTATGYKNLKKTTALIPIGVSGEYGINQMVAIGLDLGYQSNKSTFDCDSPLPCPKNTTSKGLQDPTLNLKLRNAIGVGTLRYGIKADIGIEKSKYDTDGNSNAASGGTTVTPFVGYELPLGPGFIGGKATYDVYKGDRKSHTDGVTDDTTTTAGEQLNVSAFYEANIGIMTYGGALTYVSKNESKDAVGSAASIGQKDAYNGFGVHFYTPAHLTPTIAVLPTVDIASLTFTSSGAKADSAVAFAIGVAGRFTF